jgi:organic hydroperoxide reductase OsmC/OhrA
MTPFPHLYAAHAVLRPFGDVVLEDGPRVDLLLANSPPEFGGPDNCWSPETMLVSAIGACALLTFRAMASVAKLSYESASCRVEGRLDRVDKVTSFTEFAIHARVAVHDPSDGDRARRLFEKAKDACLITNSLRAPCTLDLAIDLWRQSPAPIATVPAR